MVVVYGKLCGKDKKQIKMKQQNTEPSDFLTRGPVAPAVQLLVCQYFYIGFTLIFSSTETSIK